MLMHAERSKRDRIAIEWCLKVQLWFQIASNRDLVHGNEFPVPENGIEHVSHIYISTKCVYTTNLPLKWRPSWIFAHRESSGQGKIGENMFLYSRDMRHCILKKSALLYFFSMLQAISTYYFFFLV